MTIPKPARLWRAASCRRSAVGSAPALGAGGRGFEARRRHQTFWRWRGMNGNWWPWFDGYIPPMGMITVFDAAEENDVDNFGCRDCAHKDQCEWKKIPGMKPAKPAWSAEEYPGFPCSAFEPLPWHVRGCENWKGFWNWWNRYVDQWLPMPPDKTLVYFTVNNDTSVRYGVPLMDYVNRRMVSGSRALATLKAVEKQYYKRAKNDPIGMKLIHEKITGVRLLGGVPFDS